MSRQITRRTLVLSAMGLATAGASAAMPLIRERRGPTGVALPSMIPERLSDWTVDADAHPVLPDAEEQRSVADAYDAWLARVYRRPDGKAVMLVVAYGDGNSGTLAIHRPETCYAAQGFTVVPDGERPLQPPFANIVGRQLIATRGTRIEPVIFWMTMAGRQTGFGIGQNLALLQAVWQSKAPDGYLIRASTLEPEGFSLVETFLADMLIALSADAAARFGVSQSLRTRTD